MQQPEDLNNWISFIQWIQQSFVSNNNMASPLNRVLEECTLFFKGNEKYSESPELLSIWINLAGKLDLN